jgi:hypothetical protein
VAVALSIGQCGYDDSRIGQVVRTAIGATLDRAADPEEARRMMSAKKYDLVLVNRVFDAGTGMGVDFIADAARSENAPPMMLVSDYADAQAAAVTNGALMGFGKASIADPRMGELLRKAVASGAPQNK